MAQFQKRFLSLTELADRWGYEIASLRNASSRGTLPVLCHRLMPNGDPRFEIADVERHEAASKGVKAAA